MCSSIRSAIINTDKNFFPWPWSEQFWADFLSTRKFMLVAQTKGDAFNGFALLELFEHEKMAHLYKIILLPECRGNGAGECFHRLILDKLKANDYNRVYLEVSAVNEGALRHYRRLDYQELTTKKNFYKNGDDAVVMELSLA